MEEALKERAKILEDGLPILFKAREEPSNELIKKISIHLTLSTNVSKIMNPSSLKTDPARIIEKYGQLQGNIVVEAQNISMICPLSQSAIKHKWTSICGHSFEESAVKDYMLKGKTQCPVLGCHKKLSKVN